MASYWGEASGINMVIPLPTGAAGNLLDRLLAEWGETKEIMDKLLEVEKSYRETN